jgi:hypothetical protein
VFNQGFVNKMNDPDQARRLAEERITKLERDKERAERKAEEELAKTEESRKNEQIAKRLVKEERRRHLEVEPEPHELKARCA